MTLSAEQLFSRSSDVLQVELQEKPILLHSTKWEYLEFDEIGAVIWELLAEPRNLDSLVGTLCERYEVDEATCRRDTGALLDRLVAEQFLVASV